MLCWFATTISLFRGSHLPRYVVHKCLVTNFVPAASVKQAMNNTFVQALQKQVHAEVAETQKIVRRCESEAEAARKALQGQGVSLMRRAYVNGMQVCDIRSLNEKVASPWKGPHTSSLCIASVTIITYRGAQAVI